MVGHLGESDGRSLRKTEACIPWRVGGVLIGAGGTRERLRTRNLRRDPAREPQVFDSRGGFVTVEPSVRLLEGEDVPS